MKSETIGDRDLAAWPVAPGITWIQTRSPQFTRKLSQRSDARLVARGVAGGYLRIYEFSHGLAWAQRLIARYTVPTNARKTSPASLGSASDAAGSKTAADDSNHHTGLARA
jgi:hypothetical protein